MDTFSDVDLKLSILDPDPAPNRGGLTRMPPEGGLLTLRQGAFANRGYRTGLVACQTADCGCCAVLFQCERVRPGNESREDGAVQEFWLDVWDREVVKDPKIEQDSQTLRLADAVRKELTDADWNELFRWFRISKLEAIHTAPLEEIDTAELPDSGGGEMIGFAEVFPWGYALDFLFDAGLWTVDELYCVQPKCSCTQAVLRFLRYKDDIGKQIVVNRNAPALRYDFKSKTITAARGWPANAPDRGALMDTLKRAVPSLDNQLEFRHAIMGSLYARRMLAETQRQLGSVLSKLKPTRPTKVGRNDPCPCGSGKKYKHCCLGKRD